VLFNNAFFSLCTSRPASARGRKFKHAERYANAITRKARDTRSAQYPRFFRFSRDGLISHELSSALLLIARDRTFPPREKDGGKFSYVSTKNCRGTFSSYFLPATKGAPALPCRHVDLGTHSASPYSARIHTRARARAHVRTCHIPVVSEHPLARKSCRRRNLLGRFGELSSVSPTASRAPDVFPAHDRKYFLFPRCIRNFFYPFTVEIAPRRTRPRVLETPLQARTEDR